jgi:hypothetical protein
MKKNDPLIIPQRLGVLGAGLAAVLLISGCAGNPPTAEMALAKAAVSNASASGGNEFAPLPLRAAMDKMEGAEQAMGSENYPVARELAEEANVDAQLAAATSRAVKTQKAVNQLQQDNSVLRQELDRKTQ